MPPKDIRMIRVLVTMPPEIKTHMETLAADMGQSSSSWIRWQVQEAWERRMKRPMTVADKLAEREAAKKAIAKEKRYNAQDDRCPRISKRNPFYDMYYSGDYGGEWYIRETASSKFISRTHHRGPMISDREVDEAVEKYVADPDYRPWPGMVGA